MIGLKGIYYSIKKKDYIEAEEEIFREDDIGMEGVKSEKHIYCGEVIKIIRNKQQRAVCVQIIDSDGKKDFVPVNLIYLWEEY